MEVTNHTFMQKTPTYDLEEIKELLQDEDTRIVSRDDLVLAAKLGYPDEDAIVNRVLKVKRSEFHKSMPSKKLAKVWQDVYYTKDGATRIYVKLQISFNGKGVVVSFKERL